MGLGGTSGPWRGAYSVFNFATANTASNSGSGGAKDVFWNYTIPAGMDIVVVDAQFFCKAAGMGRVNLEAGGTSILTSAISTIGVGLATGNSVVATPANSSFGTNPPSSTPAIGAYIVGGTALTATCAAAGVIQTLTGTVLWYPAKHPNLVRSAFE